jgi:transcriptional regulator with XRE-family HTH domain
MPRRLTRSISTRAIAKRLRLIRVAYGVVKGMPHEMHPAAMARLVGVSPQAWTNYEREHNKIGLETAVQLRCMTGVTLDYVFLGDRSALPYSLAVAIAKLERTAPALPRRAR